MLFLAELVADEVALVPGRCIVIHCKATRDERAGPRAQAESIRGDDGFDFHAGSGLGNQ